MKKQAFFYVAVFLLAFTACEEQQLEPAFQDEAGRKGGQKVLTFRAHLSGDQEVPPADTKATGQAIFKLSKDGTTLTYKVIVANIQNVTMAHIHLAPAGENGGVVAWLYPDGPPPSLIPGRSNGILARGTITADDLVGALEGAELADLIEYMASEGAYVNVHTSQYPGGEIRGQIRANNAAQVDL